MKIYIEGNFLAVDREDGKQIQLLPSQRTDFNPLGSGKYYVFNTAQPSEKYEFHFSELKNKAGDLIGDESQVITYLTQNVNFKTAQEALKNRLNVTQENASDLLGGDIDPLKEYFIDGIIDCSGFSIEVPLGGINLKGYDFNISGLICSDSDYTLFTSPVGGSGDVLFQDFKIEVTGLNSKVHDLTDSTGFHAYEIARINFNNCTSRGVLNGYRQGLETGTGYFGGKPELILEDTWLGGYFIDTSIVRMLTDGTYSLFKAGGSFVMNSRFRSNQNIDLNTNVSFFDFSPSNFPNPSTLQLTGALISRNGVFNPSDSTISPNITEKDLPSSWSGNVGINNTHVGGVQTVTTEQVTNISSLGTFYVLNGIHTPSELQHFDAPANGQLRSIGNPPHEFSLISDIVLDGGSNDDVSIRVRKYDSSLASFETVFTQRRQVNNFAGGRDVAFFNINASITLNNNDYVFLEVANNSGTTNVTAELGSLFRVQVR